MSSNCKKCGKKFLEHTLKGGLCVDCQSPAYATSPSEENRRSGRILVTTASHFGSGKAFTELEIITAECVLGMNIFRDFFSSITDIVGGRSNATQKILKDLRKTCLAELKLEAYRLGADAVIGVDLDYSEFSGGGKSMLFLIASGTAVKFTETK